MAGRSKSHRRRPRRRTHQSSTALHRINLPIYNTFNPFTFFLVLSLSTLAFYNPNAALTCCGFLFTVHVYCRFVLGGFQQKLPVPSDNDIFVPLGATTHNNEKPHVVVTGGAGFLGFQVVQHLLKDDPTINITVIDLYPPHPTRTIHHVRYITRNLAVDNLKKALEGADVVIHTAGVVDLTAEEAVTHNAHVVGTARILAASRRAGVRVFVHTSSIGCVTSPYLTTREQSQLSGDYVPPEIAMLTFPFFSSYSSTKFKSERLALHANEVGFRTVAVRLPMIFGLQDPMVTRPLFKGERDRVPDGDGALVEFVYVKNAAAMHVRCMHALLEEEEKREEEEEEQQNRNRNSHPTPKIAGRVFNVTNGDVPQEATTVWNALIEKINAARSRGGSRRRQNDSRSLIPSMKTVPFYAMYTVACVTESIFQLCCGQVPARRHPIWNLTRAVLTLSCTTVTQDMTATLQDLKYTPQYTTLEAFDDMVAEEQRLYNNNKNNKAADDDDSDDSDDSDGRNASPLASISWSPPKGVSFDNVGVFDRMSGPGMTVQETCVTTVGMCGGMYYAYWQRQPEWSNVQVGISLMYALVNASAVAQCTTSTSKRWYHMHGRLPNHLAYVIAVEVAVLVCLLHATFGNNGRGGLDAAFSYKAGIEMMGMSVVVLITHFSPLAVQRAVGVLCMCGGLALLQGHHSLCTPAGVDSTCPGMEWCIPLLLVKYCVSHVPRHEPYT